MGELAKLVNIGPALEAQLAQAGITTAEQLRATGSREAWLRIYQNDPSACINRMYGLEGAVQNIRWHHLPEEDKATLRTFVMQHKGRLGP